MAEDRSMIYIVVIVAIVAVVALIILVINKPAAQASGISLDASGNAKAMYTEAPGSSPNDANKMVANYNARQIAK